MMLRAIALVLLTLLAGCASPLESATLDEAAPVPELPRLDVTNETYDFGVMVATTSRLMAPATVRIHGAMYRPEGEGPYPVLLFMHGNHGTCFVGGFYAPGLGVCRNIGPMQVDPSFAGYSYLAEDLASRGYVVLSIDANDVNDNNQVDDLGSNQRAQLFLRTLDELAALDDPQLDLARVGLMGHSRGGDGASRAVILNAERAQPHAILAVLALAPTDFIRHEVTGVAFGTILPYCDGDVNTLHGAWLYDDARHLDGAGPLHQWLVMGANHNFFNEVWDFDDARFRDPDDRECGPDAPSRLTPEAQRAIGLDIMGSFFRHHVGGDDHGAQLRGETPFVSAAIVHASYWPPADERILIDNTLDDASLTTNDRGGTFALEGARDASVCITRAAARGPMPMTLIDPLALLQGGAQGTCPTEPNDSTAPQLTFEHDATARATWDFPATDASTMRYATLRIAIDFEASDNAPALAFVLRDATGASARVPAQGGLFHPPGDEAYAKLVLNDIRAPLDAFDDIDLTQLTALELHIEGEPGRLYVTDIAIR